MLCVQDEGNCATHLAGFSSLRLYNDARTNIHQIHIGMTNIKFKHQFNIHPVLLVYIKQNS